MERPPKGVNGPSIRPQAESRSFHCHKRVLPHVIAILGHYIGQAPLGRLHIVLDLHELGLLPPRYTLSHSRSLAPTMSTSRQKICPGLVLSSY